MISAAGIVDERRALTAIADPAREPAGEYPLPDIEDEGFRVENIEGRLLLIHGTAASTHTWRDLMPMLATSYDVVAMDLPGHAYTTLRPDGAMTLDALSASVASLTDAVGFKPDCLVAHSAGAAKHRRPCFPSRSNWVSPVLPAPSAGCWSGPVRTSTTAAWNSISVCSKGRATSRRFSR